jgi:hypothetical protein
MKQTVFAVAVAAFALVGAAGVAQAAPVAPMPSAVAADHGNVTTVQYWWHHRHWHHRNCRPWHGHMRCRYW